jgi:thiol-disulfide isomerase/thioredoxin
MSRFYPLPLFLLGAVLLCSSPVSRADDSVDTSKPVDLQFTAVDGRQVDLAKLRGKVVLIDFWATWCPPCRAISPDIVAAYNKYHSQGLDIIGISVDSDKSALIAFTKAEGAPWPQYFSDDGSDNPIAARFGVEMFPTLFLLDKKGKIVTSDLYSQVWLTDGGYAKASPEVAKAKLDALLTKLLSAP